MITHLRHTGLVVADLDLALHLWCDILGFRIAKRMEESGIHVDAMLGLEDVHVTTVKIAAPDEHMVELLYFHSHPDKPRWTGAPYSTGFTHIALTVTDLDAVCSKLAAAGATFCSPPQKSPDGSVKVTYCRCPDGVFLELVEEISDGR